MSSVPESILAKLRKIRALAEEGIDGERVAAQRQLDRLLAEHGVTLEELASVAVREYSAAYRAVDERRLFTQICAQVLDSSHPPVTFRRKARIAFIECTAAQWADIKDRYAHYVRQLRAEKAAARKRMALLAVAMIQRHGIFPEHPETSAEKRELTEQEKRELLELFRAMRSLGTQGFVQPVPRLEAPA